MGRAPSIVPAEMPEISGCAPLPVLEDDKTLPLIEDDELVDLLRRAPNEMLELLVEFVCEKGRPTSKLEQTENYRKHAPNHQMYVNEIAAEIQRYGANDIASLFRGGNGVRYSEIVNDVAKRCGVKSCSKTTEKLEKEIVKKMFCDAYAKMTPEQKEEVLRSLRIRNLRGASAPLSLVGFHSAVNAAGFSAYQLTVIVANGMAQALLGHGLGFATNWILVKSVYLLAGPLGLAFAALFSANMLAGPAYRVTIPCVVQVALIRQELKIQQRRRLLHLLTAFLIGGAIALLTYFFLLKR
jgi:uncharacterized protein YaaW (UPF0174 family)